MLTVILATPQVCLPRMCSLHTHTDRVCSLNTLPDAGNARLPATTHYLFSYYPEQMKTLIQATPDVCVRKLEQGDRFVIIASQGVWKFLTKQEAVELVGQV